MTVEVTMSRADRADRALMASLRVRAEFEIKALKPPLFMGKPDRWFDIGKWRCRNDHVSTAFLKSEEHGALCLGCYAMRNEKVPVFITFPEDTEGPLAPIIPIEQVFLS